MTDLMQDHGPAAPRIGLTRAAIGFVAGIALWALTEAGEHRGGWATTHPALFGALAAIALFVPFVLVGGLGALRARTLALWAAGGGLVLAGLGAHDLVRQFEPRGEVWLSPELMGFGAAGLFIAHHLVEGGDGERRVIARYPRYFEIAWKHGVQLALSAAFVGVFWIVLYLGGALFNLIGIKALGELLEKSWFALPATATMFAAAVHLTDVRAGLIRGIRTVALTLLSWLLPVLVLLAGAFLLALPFTGLEPLWKTRSAASILLSAAAVLIVLINAAYQDGEPDQTVPLPLRGAGRLGGFLLVALVGLAAYALWLRISQYGLTPDRIVGAACAIAGAVYAVGYAAAAVRLGRWMRWVEKTNIVAAFVILALLLAIFSPLADPARLSVNDQMSRLASGRTTADKLDYRFLRFKAERYGHDALVQLKARGGEAGRRAVVALADTNRWETPTPVEDKAVQGDPRTLDLVWPAGATFSQPFLATGWLVGDAKALGCTVEAPCAAALLDLNDDGEAEVIVAGRKTAVVLTRAGRSDWWSALQTGIAQCPGFIDALKSGQVSAQPSPWRDLVVGGKRVAMDEQRNDCDPSPPAKPKTVHPRGTPTP